MLENIIYFSRLREGAKIPSKRLEDAGYDIYPCFDDDFRMITPHTTVKIPTGIASAFDSNYYMQIQDRGYLGSEGITCAAGVINSGYRGEWFICLTNTTDSCIAIYKEGKEDELPYQFPMTIYSYDKAIAQAVPHIVPQLGVLEMEYSDLKRISSERGTGKLGSSGK